MCIFAWISAVYAEPAEYKILYLIPFETDSYTTPYIKESEDMDNVKSYQLMGFWNGAQMALEEYKGRNMVIQVVVKDISNDERKLRRVMEDEDLMRGMNLIVGTFFGKLFEIAAGYAKQYRKDTRCRQTFKSGRYSFLTSPC